MIAVIQRVTQASVSIPTQSNSISHGYLILLGVADNDTSKDALLLANKTIKLRLMSDSQQKMNLSLTDSDGELLVVSQFTLLGDVSKGNRPSFVKAAPPSLAQKLYHEYVKIIKDAGLKVKTGFFGQYMQLNLINDGPTTIIINSKQLKQLNK